ncbi:MAG: hypothetical protein NXI07_11930 [bacterium]|nr:hypothetical protein [bacterium]
MVEKIVEVPVEKIMEVRVPQIVEIPVQHEKVIERIVRIPVQSGNPEGKPEVIERIVEVPKIIVVPKVETVEKVVEVERLVPTVDLTTPRETKSASTQTDLYGCPLDVLDQLEEFEIIPQTRTTGNAASSAAASSPL